MIFKVGDVWETHNGLRRVVIRVQPSKIYCEDESGYAYTYRDDGMLDYFPCAYDLVRKVSSLKPKLELVAGLFYKLRDGLKAVVYSTEAGGQHPVHGAFFRNGAWVVTHWASDGKFDRSRSDNHYDIVGPWIDRPKVCLEAFPNHINWWAQNLTGDWWCFTDKPVMRNAGFFWLTVYGGGYDRSFKVMNTDCPQYEGPWEESLISREEVEEMNK